MSFRFYNIHYFLESFITNFIIIIAKNANITNTTDSKIIPCKSIKNKPLKINYDIIITIKKGERMLANTAQNCINGKDYHIDLFYKIIEIVKKSFIEIIQGSINKTPESSTFHIKRGYATQISITFQNNKVYDFLFVFNKAFLKIMCEDFLFEEKPTLGSMVDMSKELANLTIGHAKVLAQAQNIHFNISTPNFLAIKKSNKDDLSFKLDECGYCNVLLKSNKSL